MLFYVLFLGEMSTNVFLLLIADQSNGTTKAQLGEPVNLIWVTCRSMHEVLFIGAEMTQR